MTKGELIDALAVRQGMDLRTARKAVNSIFGAMSQAMARGERIELRGFGSFQLRAHRAYEALNPRTGEPLIVGGKKVPLFRQAKEMKERLNPNGVD